MSILQNLGFSGGIFGDNRGLSALWKRKKPGSAGGAEAAAGSDDYGNPSYSVGGEDQDLDLAGYSTPASTDDYGKPTTASPSKLRGKLKRGLQGMAGAGQVDYGQGMPMVKPFQITQGLLR